MNTAHNSITLSDKFLVSQKEINKFAEVSGGMGLIHTDPEFTKKTVFKKTLVHGLYLLALIEREANRLLTEAGTINEIKVTYLKPVLVDEEFHIEFYKEDEKNYSINLFKDEEIMIIGKVLIRS